jgi:hypothetical protein
MGAPRKSVAVTRVVTAIVAVSLSAACSGDGRHEASDAASETTEAVSETTDAKATGPPPTTTAAASADTSSGEPVNIEACELLSNESVVAFIQRVTGVADATIENVGPLPGGLADCVWRLTGSDYVGPDLAVELFLASPTDDVACGFSGTELPVALPGLGFPAHSFSGSLVTVSLPTACIALQRGGPLAVSLDALNESWVGLLNEGVESLSR